MSRLAIIVPVDPDATVRWQTVADGGIVARGTGDDWPRLDDQPTPATLFVPAAATALHRALLPGLPVRQAAAAARLMALENALGDPDTLHVATGPRDADGGLDVAVAANADMAHWLAWAERHHIDALALVPAPLLLPRPEEGFARGRVGGEEIARDAATAFAVEPETGPLLIGEAPVTDIGPDAVDRALIAALDDPPLDLRQGVFARRQRQALDWKALERMAVLAGLALVVGLAISLVTIVKLHRDTAARDAEALAAARTIVPGVSDVVQAEAALDARAAATGAGGRGFAGSAARLLAAVEQNPSVVLGAFDYGSDGSMRATISGGAQADLDSTLSTLRAGGATAAVAPGPAVAGRPSTIITVTAR